MRNVTLLTATISRYAFIHMCLAVFFAFCWFAHCLAILKMEAFGRQFIVMNDSTMRAMTLIDWVAANSWLAIAYVCLVFASVAFLQVRGHPRWTCWIVALIYCIPCAMYWMPCAYIAGKFFAPVIVR